MALGRSEALRMSLALGAQGYDSYIQHSEGSSWCVGLVLADGTHWRLFDVGPQVGAPVEAWDAWSRVCVDGRHLRLRRGALGLSQAALAQRLGVDVNTVARWERGDRPIANPVMVGLALEALSARTGARTPDPPGPSLSMPAGTLGIKEE